MNTHDFAKYLTQIIRDSAQVIDQLFRILAQGAGTQPYYRSTLPLSALANLLMFATHMDAIVYDSSLLKYVVNMVPNTANN